MQNLYQVAALFSCYVYDVSRSGWRLCHLYNMASSESGDFQKVLEYRIYKCSSYSSSYIPEWVSKSASESRITTVPGNNGGGKLPVSRSLNLKTIRFEQSLFVFDINRRDRGIPISRLNDSFFFFSRNIIVDKPSDQTSRWSSDIDNHPQVRIIRIRLYHFSHYYLLFRRFFSTLFLSFKVLPLSNTSPLVNMKKRTYVI